MMEMSKSVMLLDLKNCKISLMVQNDEKIHSWPNCSIDCSESEGMIVWVLGGWDWDKRVVDVL